MNYLAHLVLAKPNAASRIGNLLGDFAKGTEESLLEKFPEDVVEGIMMHRSIDKFTDEHELFDKAKELLVPERRRYAGVIVDIIFDHFLSIHWEKYMTTPREEFIETCLRELEDNPDWLTDELRDALPRMREHDCLGSYATVSGIRKTFERVSNRGKYTAPLAEAIDDLNDNYKAFEDIFLEFFPKLRSYSSGKNMEALDELLGGGTMSNEELIKLWTPQAFVMAEKKLNSSSIARFFETKGVPKDDALAAAEKLKDRAAKERGNRQQKLLLPGTILMLISPVFIISIFTGHGVGSAPSNVIASIATFAIGYFIAKKSKSVS